MRRSRSIAAAIALGALAGCAAERGVRSACGPQHLNAPGRADTLPFSHGVLCDDTFYVAGTLGIDRATGRPPDDVEQEIRLLLDDVKAKLALAGMSMEDLVTVQVFCPDLALYDTFNRVYAGYFPSGRFPARAFIGSGPLLRGCRFEVNGVAVRGR